MPAIIDHDSPEYREYMNSYEWRLKKSQALGLYGGACAACHSKRSLDVHHKTYANWRNESLGDLIVLCRECHDGVHAVWSTVKAGGATSRSLAEVTEDYIRETHEAAARDRASGSIIPNVAAHEQVTKEVAESDAQKSKVFLIPKVLLSVLLSIVFFELIVFVLLFAMQGSKAVDTLHLWNAALFTGAVLGTVIGLPAGLIRGFRQIRRERDASDMSRP